ncbi:hypothetical protein [Niabella hibiscisoli]|uniref:hypothetical protein n=1 Tax=Niabella hibiscisoli TaxID=1825928 RepID=UPI001F0EDD55|nr:hypothetical protein [Niabella hibiscisoli]MCH5716707.1 hypothetical protein [Niabella hibiscisoli]
MNKYNEIGRWVKTSSKPRIYMTLMGDKMIVCNLNHVIINDDHFYGEMNIYTALQEFKRKRFPRNDFE